MDLAHVAGQAGSLELDAEGGKLLFQRVDCLFLRRGLLRQPLGRLALAALLAGALATILRRLNLSL